MRFGAAFIPAMPAAEVARTALLAEDAGYDVLWIPDQSFYADPFVLLAVCAGATSRIGLGLAVTNPSTRHPVQIARAAAALDDLSGGRFRLGLGAGNRTHVLPALGAPTDRTVARLHECVEVCRRLLRGETVSVHSPTLRLDRVRLETAPRPDLPIYVAGRAPRILRLGGAVADGVIAEAMFTPEGLDYALDEIAAGARSTGRDPALLDLVAWQAVHLAGVPGDDPERVRSWAGRLLRGTPRAVLDRLGIAGDVDVEPA
jgi:5,10-methylenetetrahydromethanopterin reductase